MHVPTSLTSCLGESFYIVISIILMSRCADKSMHCLCFPELRPEMNVRFLLLLLLRHNKIRKCVT
jgi:hypothetical protein